MKKIPQKTTFLVYKRGLFQKYCSINIVLTIRESTLHKTGECLKTVVGQKIWNSVSFMNISEPSHAILCFWNLHDGPATLHTYLQHVSTKLHNQEVGYLGRILQGTVERVSNFKYNTTPLWRPDVVMPVMVKCICFKIKTKWTLFQPKTKSRSRAKHDQGF